ncbi:rCG36359 [Rattus norvegicus]|uniref:RCG36359 n=1 Tax=Rattus norvegicus TaxID=10116 RepID=A6IQ91_RAT|nr:rCG36359 [Rattus norvegicus]
MEQRTGFSISRFLRLLPFLTSFHLRNVYATKHTCKTSIQNKHLLVIIMVFIVKQFCTIHAMFPFIKGESKFAY